MSGSTIFSDVSQHWIADYWSLEADCSELFWLRFYGPDAFPASQPALSQHY